MVRTIRDAVIGDLRRAARAVHRFFWDEVSPRPLAVLRIALGAYAVLYFVELYWLLELNYGEAGLLAGGHLGDFLALGEITVLGPVAGNGTRFHLLYAVTLAAAFGVALGFSTRLSTFALWLLQMSWLGPLPAGNNGADDIITIVSFLLMVAALAGHAQRVWSVDAVLWPRAGSPRGTTVPAWTTRLFQVQLVLIYFFAGWHKLAVADWYHGEALGFILQQKVWARFDTTWLAGSPLAVVAASYGTLFFEVVVFPVLVWVPALRPWVLVAGCLLHVAIAALIKVHVFTAILPIFYLCFCGGWVADRIDALRNRYRSLPA